MRKVGIQLYSIREQAEANLEETLKTLAQQGYDGVQLAGTYNKTADEWQALLSENHLQAAGMHVPLEVLTDEAVLEETIAFSRKIGNDKLIIPYLPEEKRTAEGYHTLAEQLTLTVEKVKEAGLRFGYHHHDFEFATVEQSTGWEIIEQGTPDEVHFEIDAYWTSFAGIDTPKLLSRLGDRVFSLHVKDMKEGDERISTTVGDGVLPLREYVEQTETDWVIVEQEHFEGDPVTEVGASARVLKNWLQTDN